MWDLQRKTIRMSLPIAKKVIHEDIDTFQKCKDAIISKATDRHFLNNLYSHIWKLNFVNYKLNSWGRDFD